MSTVAVLGAGPIGASVAHTLAQRTRVRDIRLIDAAASVAAGKALDIRQTGPVQHYDTRLSGHGDPLSAIGADVIVVADRHDGGEWSGDEGLALVRRLIAAGATSPFVFAGPGQTWLMETVAAELGWPADRMLGSAAAAMPAAARALVAIELNLSGVDIHLTACGRPPALAYYWSCATVGGAPLSARLPPHRRLAISEQLRRLWPAGPYAIACATAPIVEGLIVGTRRDVPAVTVLDGQFGTRGLACLMPVHLASGRIVSRLEPACTPQERTETINGLRR